MRFQLDHIRLTSKYKSVHWHGCSSLKTIPYGVLVFLNFKSPYSYFTYLNLNGNLKLANSNLFHHGQLVSSIRLWKLKQWTVWLNTNSIRLHIHVIQVSPSRPSIMRSDRVEETRVFLWCIWFIIHTICYRIIRHKKGISFPK